LQEFATATTCIPIEIPIENLNWNSHGCRSKLVEPSPPATESTLDGIFAASICCVICQTKNEEYLLITHAFVEQNIIFT